MHAIGTQTNYTQTGALTQMRSSQFVYGSSVSLQIDQEWPPSFCLCDPPLYPPLYSAGAFILIRSTKATRSQQNAHNLMVWEGGKKKHAGTLYFCRYRAIRWREGCWDEAKTDRPWKGQLSNTNTRLFLARIPVSILVWQKEQQQPGLSILLLGCNLFLCMSNNNEEDVVIGLYNPISGKDWK